MYGLSWKAAWTVHHSTNHTRLGHSLPANHAGGGPACWVITLAFGLIGGDATRVRVEGVDGVDRVKGGGRAHAHPLSPGWRENTIMMMECTPESGYCLYCVLVLFLHEIRF